MWRDEFGTTYGPVTDARYDPKTLIAMDRIIHIGGGTGTFGVKTKPTRWDGVAPQREGRRRLVARLFTGVWHAVRRVLMGFGQKVTKPRVKNVA